MFRNPVPIDMVLHGRTQITDRNGKTTHTEEPFGVVSPDVETVFSVRTMPEGIVHASSDPWGYLTGRMSPLLPVEEETRTGIPATG